MPDPAEGGDNWEAVDEPGVLEEPASVDCGLDEAAASELNWGLEPPDGGELAAETGDVVDATLVDFSELPEPSPLLAALVTDGELASDKPRLPLLAPLGGWEEASLVVDECGGELAMLDWVVDGESSELAADRWLDAPEVVDS